MKKYIILFGAPASGKGTQAEMLGEKLGLPLLSPGVLLRREIENKTGLGERIEPLLDQGKLVDDAIVESIVAKELACPEAEKGVIFDGYPRSIIQQEFLLKELNGYLKDDDKICAIMILVSEETILGRLGGRRACSCGETYHIVTKPPKKEGVCDACGRALHIRDDDKPEVILERLKIYYREIDEMLDYWRKNGKLIEINGNNSIEKMGQDIEAELKKIGIIP
jgi:adenylate kinase